MRTLYLHIGTHRTATSSIQAFMHANNEILPGMGILYPYNVRRHLQLANQILNGQRDVAEVARDLNARADSRKADIHSIVLSDEDISMRGELSVLKQFRDHFDVKVIFSLRRQDLWLESWFLQNIKWQWNKSLSHCTFDEFLARRGEFHWAAYNSYVQHLEALFGKENIILQVFEKEQMRDGPVVEFARAIGITSMDGLTQPPHINSSQSPMMTEFMRCLPLDEAPPNFRSHLEKACSQVDGALIKEGADSSSLLIDHATRLEILAEHAPGNRLLAQRYFGRDQLFIAPVPGPDAPVAPMRLPDDSYDTMRKFVEPFVRALIAAEKDRQVVLPGAGPGQRMVGNPAVGGPGGKKQGQGKGKGGKKGKAGPGSPGGPRKSTGVAD